MDKAGDKQVKQNTPYVLTIEANAKEQIKAGRGTGIIRWVEYDS